MLSANHFIITLFFCFSKFRSPCHVIHHAKQANAVMRGNQFDWDGISDRFSRAVQKPIPWDNRSNRGFGDVDAHTIGCPKETSFQRWGVLLFKFAQ